MDAQLHYAEWLEGQLSALSDPKWCPECGSIYYASDTCRAACGHRLCEVLPPHVAAVYRISGYEAARVMTAKLCELGLLA